jgi:PAS domain S-box-containing protein
MKIAFKILIALFLVITVSTGTIAFTVAYLGRKSIEKQVGERQLQMAQGIMDKIDRFMSERYGDIRVTAARLNVVKLLDGGLDQTTRQSLAKNLAESADILGTWHRFAVLDKNGNEVIASGESNPDENVFKESDVKVQEIFKKALTGETADSDVIYSEETKNFTIAVMAPVKNSAGEIIGAVEGYVNYEKILDILAGVQGPLVILVNKNEVEIGSNDSARRANILKEKYGGIVAMEKSMEAINRSVVAPSIQGKKLVLSSHVHGKGAGFFGGNDWMLSFETPIDEAYQEADKTTLISVLISYFSGMVGLMIIVFIINRAVIGPVENLTAITKRISHGRLDERVPVKSIDEIGELAISFNQMTERLKESYNTLEAKVRERTADLDKSNRDLEGKNRSLEEKRQAIAELLSDVKRSRDAALSERARFEALLESIGDGVSVTDEKGVLVYLNPAAEKITQYQAKEAIGKNLFDLLKATDFEGKPVAPETRPLYRALHNKITSSATLMYMRKDKGFFPASVTTSAVILDKKAVGSITTFHDITDELAKQRLIEEQRAKYESLITSIGEGIVAVDTDGRVIFANQAVERMTGLKTADCFGKKWVETQKAFDMDGKPMPPESHPIIAAIKAGKVMSSNLIFERQDKSTFPITATASPVIIGGKVVGAVAAFKDITKEMEVDKAKSEFVSLASHQLKTPMAAIKWYLELLTSGDAGKLNKDQKSYLSEIQQSNLRMNGLVDALLNVSRIELGTFIIEPEPSNVLKIADEAASELEPQIRAKKIKFTKTYDRKLPEMMVDRKLINIIFQNLLSNAVKYTPAKGKVALNIKRSGEDVMIAVSDSGMGIPANQQDKIFKRMFRAENAVSSQTEGTGLGLYLVKSILENAGGKIWFESAEGKGANFYVTLPLSGMIRREGTRKLS